ncbi:unnamed protein product [Calypogeia fissa]
MLRFVSMDESQALQEICEYNDISEDQLMVAENITNLEMFLFNFTRICCMTFFPNLTSLSLVQQNLRTIEGLHCLPHLEILRLSENEIQRIEGLSNCLKLKELYLHNNCITRITNLSHLSGLRVLWLANNLIKWVEGLENLQIKELNMAKNPLCQLGKILKINTLKYLNVSGTGIGSFKEISNLTRLKKLTDLRFSDPHWGPSPLALLHNYQTYILFRLQDLQKLDTMELTDEAKQTAKATYTRKRVYYNLCIKSLQQSKRNSNTFINESNHIKGLQKNLAQYIKMSRDIDKNIMTEIHDLDKSNVDSKEPSETSQDKWSKSKINNESGNQQICALLKRLDHLNKELQVSKAREQAAIDLSIHWLIVELDSGGNIRMENGNSKDIWYKSCIELVTSRFFVDDYAPLGISGVQVNKVTRIHNRFLQDRFERQHEYQMLKPGNKSVEYLLCGETLQVHNELQNIVEGGFPLSSDQLMNSQNSSPVLLSNSVGLADCCRLKVFAEHLNVETPSKTTPGWVLVVKTCLGTSVKDVRCKYTQIPCKECCKSSPVDGEGIIARKSSYPHADSVYRSHPTDSKQRSWFVFDAAVVVPEYLVEFEYNFTNSNKALGGQISQSQVETSSEVADLLGTGLGDLFPNLCSAPPLLLNTNDLPLTQIDSSLFGPREAQKGVPSPCGASHLSSEFPKVNIRLSADFILKARKRDILDLQLMTQLNLHDSNITEIEALGELHCLKVLVLCFNKISKIRGLDGLLLLERLDLSYNLLTKIEGLNGLGSLTSLDLGGNQIWNPTDLALVKVPKLLSLNLRVNPIVDDQDYPMMVLKAISSLIELDDNSVTSQERIEANRKYFSSPAEMFSSPTPGRRNLLSSMLVIPTHDHHKDLKQENSLKFKNEKAKLPRGMQNDTDVKVLEETLSSTDQGISKQPGEMCNMSMCQFYPTHMLVTYDMLEKGRAYAMTHDKDWLEDIEEVHLEGHKLETMYCFDKLYNLRRLYLCDNNISVIEGLDNCSMLEELILSFNNIQEVKGIKHVQELWRLDLSHNCLVCCDEMGSFQSLEQLSIDDNKIQSLKGLDTLMSLMELYAANNLLADFNELNYIRNLPKLIVVDLLGNTFCESDEYRIYTIYTLRKLKVLDGKNVETNELTQARNKYLGRLNEDILRDCLEHSQFSKLEVLDLSGQKLRSCGNVFENPQLHGLTELNLNDNMLSSIFPLRLLKNLRTLQLENNKFEDRPLFEAPTENTLEMSFSTNPLTPLLSTTDVDGTQGKTTIIPQTVLCEDGICLPSLEILKLGGNSITSMSSLWLESKFPRLKLLALPDNKIDKVDGLAGLSSLEKLYLDHNNIKDVEEFSFDQVQNLRVLCLSYNALKTLAHMDKLVALECLELASNQIAPGRMGGLASIENLSGLPKLLKLSFINSPICRQNLYRVSIISRLSQLHYLDEREITKACFIKYLQHFN